MATPRWRAGIRPPARPGRFDSTGRRPYSSDLGEGKTGHIHADSNEAIVFFNNVFPVQLQWLLHLPIKTEKTIPEVMKRVKSPTVAAADPLKIIQKAKLEEHGKIKITDFLPRVKEGGAFVKFSHDASTTPSQIEEKLKAYLKDKQIKPWWNPFERIRVNLVKGRPWVEDLYRSPSPRLKVEFVPTSPGAEAAELSQEQLYSFFRPYGKLSDIISQPSDSKIIPKFAYLDFASIRRSTMAKNCLHGFVVPSSTGGGKAGTLLRLTYAPKAKAHWIRDWLFNHPRIVVPAVAALVAGITVAIFDPLRTWFVEAHITRAFHITDSSVFRWLKSQAGDALSSQLGRLRELGGGRGRRSGGDVNLEAIWDDRKNNIEQVRTWLDESVDTFMVVTGPRGSGKRELIDQALGGEERGNRRDRLVLDCKPIQEARGDAATINAAAAQVGYRPVFSWMNSISGLIDMAAQGAAGVKPGFSETLDSQLGKIWNTTAVALKRIALHHRKKDGKDDKDAQLPDDEWLEAHPEHRPVLIVENFGWKSQQEEAIYDKIAEWASRLTTTNVAHVIFLANDSSFSKYLSRALPDRVFRQISLSDCTPEVARRFVLTHLQSDSSAEGEFSSNSTVKTILDRSDGNRLKKAEADAPSTDPVDLDLLDDCLERLGGRLTDLEFFARRIKAGETPSGAVNTMISQSSSEILKMYLLPPESTPSSSSAPSTQPRDWTPVQAYHLVTSLCDSPAGTIPYASLLQSYPFSGSYGVSALRALERAELISVTTTPSGRPSAVKPSRPIFLSAFRALAKDRVLGAQMRSQSLGERIAGENAAIRKAEEELGELMSVAEKAAGAGGVRAVERVRSRVLWLVGKIEGSQKKVEEWEREKGAVGKVVDEEF
ncbi:RNA12 protein-domain-containing protein [Lineolata rhizophorae]|uniref:Mitochondrial escape protein 2 n=1 Tax=Lineolata rhizophorae TaxID=578093 RepID=A0A6A6PEX3_9PEZI|nr:RNA12 protein-domain-containing protein [Lineolata rhizophorae]